MESMIEDKKSGQQIMKGSLSCSISRPSLSPSVSIIIEPVCDDDSSYFYVEEDDQILEENMHSSSSRATHAKVQDIMEYAKTRQNEFARLLQEHAEIVHQINKFEGILS